MIWVILLLTVLWTTNTIQAQNTVFNPLEEKCCSGKSYPRSPNKYMRCCGTSMLDSTEQICCNKRPMNMTYGLNTKCCGSNVFSIQEKICCPDGKLISYPQGATDKTKPYYICCDGQAMDTRINVCCNRKINKILNGPTLCCGDIAYNYNTEICCDGTKASKQSSECCGSKPFDKTKQLCCFDYKNNVYNIHSQSDGNSCCLGKPINSNTSICCSDYSIAAKKNPEDSSCCNKQVFDPESQLCCDGKLIKPPPNVKARQMQCCGDSAFQYSTGQQCCNSKEIYNIKDSVCCYGNTAGNSAVIPKKSEFASCCGTSSSYDTSSELCCGDKTFPNPNGNLQCCNSTTYDPSKQTCCGDSVVDNKDDKMQECCTPEMFNDDYTECLRDIYSQYPIQF